MEDLPWEEISGRGDPRQRYRIYRLCPGETEPELIATCESEAAVGVTLCTLGREEEFDGCPVGVLDTMGEINQKWIVTPWLPSPRNLSDAGRMLRRAR